DLSNHSLKIDYYNSMVGFSTDAHIPNSISFGYNVGGIGGISPSTQSLINLFHNTASQRLYKPIDYRRNMKDAGTLNFNYSLPIAGKNYTQQVYVDFGTRMLVDFNYEKISEYYPENFFKVQLSGQLPFTLGTLFDNTNYLAG